MGSRRRERERLSRRRLKAHQDNNTGANHSPPYVSTPDFALPPPDTNITNLGRLTPGRPGPPPGGLFIVGRIALAATLSATVVDTLARRSCRLTSSLVHTGKLTLGHPPAALATLVAKSCQATLSRPPRTRRTAGDSVPGPFHALFFHPSYALLEVQQFHL